MAEGDRRPILRGERIFLRPAERDDIPTFLDWLADAEVGEGLSNRAPWSRAAEEGWYEDLQKRQGQTMWHFVI
jgi:RimJ/RimL family protein N-acetyltransferase